ncbi:glycoside hydrolase family 1 protein [Hydnomerulius pinastri MD-312]|uniref:Glycoside hydrolase family 1 protein n=1 Tax=Hydnomerulius pinastri MD-312 TaxID=994086 RepID=A0A0C9W084_9AGAM|nr:glycoside hydrolase family 1 protein [Hydnomerulius pinastri MD-312]
MKLLALPSLLLAAKLSRASVVQPAARWATTTTASSVPAATAASPTAPAASPTVTFPAVGSIPRDFSPQGLEELWSLVGSVEPPPFTTTREPSLPIPVPSPPPALYPSWYAPAPSAIFPNLSLPEGFIFGVATSAYQVEGATKMEGKGPTNWDWASRQPGFIQDNTTADITDLNYYLYKEDAARAAAIGVTAHSFSISWARIYPFGVAGSPLNQEGLDHYSDVIDSHLAVGVDPVVTLYHWDTPLALDAYYGGFTSPQIVDDFVNYAKTVFQAYNGRVKTWYTFNEPSVSCGSTSQYPFNASMAPGVNISTAPYQCAYNLLKAHAGAVKAFREMGIQGEIAYKNNDFVGLPWRSNTTDDIEAVERHASFGIGLYANPVYVNGDWPQIVKDTLPESYLPRFTEEEMADLKGSADFFAIDSYASQYVAAPPSGTAGCQANMSDPAWPACNSVVLYDSNAGWAVGPSPDPASNSWLQATPQMLRGYLKELVERWPSDKLYISEFGMDEPYESMRTEMFQILEDSTTTNYFMTNLGEALLAIHEDGIPLMGTFSWGMIDNAEWNYGLEPKFGIQHVNYTTLERTYKRSAYALCVFTLVLCFYMQSLTLRGLVTLAEFFASHGISNSNATTV